MRKSIKNATILKYLDIVTPILPAPIYWEDVNSVILGGNEPVLKATGTFVKEAYVGKTLYELYPTEMANHIKQHNEEVMLKGEILSQEEVIKDITTGNIKYFKAVKAPLRDDDGNIIGIIGTSVDITAEKEAEKLKLENAAQIGQLKEQEKFMKLANQVAHDIRSPLASLLMLVKACAEIPEINRIALREAATSIGDIANHLLNQYEKREPDSIDKNEERQAILISALLLQLLTDKKYQYQELSIKFHADFTQAAHFAFIKIAPSSFKRMISNIINNAVEAYESKIGKIEVNLTACDKFLKIIIKDNGKGMPQELIDKISNNVAITSGKKSGHGIGLTQVRETLQANQGNMSIVSNIGSGTSIILTFPRILAPSWIAEEICLEPTDIVVILDDDNSIHGAWQTRFDDILETSPEIQLNHFMLGKDIIDFFSALTTEQQKKVFLLADYELLNQGLTGLDVIARLQLQRAILVTSHYADPSLHLKAAKTGTKILPKQLASEILINIVQPTQSPASARRHADLIIVDDNKSFARNLALFIFTEKVVDQYHNPLHFLENLSHYQKDIQICLDNNFDNSSIKGIELAADLHKQGFTRLYLLTGETLSQDAVPAYLTVIRKDDLDKLKKL